MIKLFLINRRMMSYDTSIPHRYYKNEIDLYAVILHIHIKSDIYLRYMYAHVFV